MTFRVSGKQDTDPLTPYEAAEMAAKWVTIYPSDRAAIKSAVLVLPADQQCRATYGMTMRATASPYDFSELEGGTDD